MAGVLGDRGRRHYHHFDAKTAANADALLKGPLLRHDDHSAGVRYALGTMWAWGDEMQLVAVERGSGAGERDQGS